MKKKITIAGAGGIGRACGLILLQHFGNEIQLELADINPKQCHQSASWILSGLSASYEIKSCVLPDGDLSNWNPDGSVLLDCTPGEFAPQFARVALANKMHYANLTENIHATRYIYDIAKNATTAFALQTGLAPGFINQLARKTVDDFNNKHPGFTIDSIRMRVGSLSQYASSPSYYAFVWNPMGVSNEYLNESEIIDNFNKVTKSSLTEREKIIINGVVYEADLTSGGAADLPDFYEGKVRELNYKTLRYSGHYDYINRLKVELGSNLTKELLLRKLMEDIPFQNQDRVLIYCSVSGKNPQEKTYEIIRHHEILPASYNQVRLTAIQRATASALAQTATLLLSDQYSGLLTQSRYPLEAFINGEIIREHYGNFIEKDY